MNAREQIAFLVGSECRIELLRELAATPGRPIELADRCPCTRETIQRALAEFVERGWAEKGERKYRLTPSGEMVHEQYESLAETVVAVDRLDSFLAHAGEATRELDLTVLADLTVTDASADRPYAPLERYLSVLDGESPSRFYGITPIVSRMFNETSAEAIGPETAVELVVDESVLEASKELFPRALRRAYELDQMSLYLSPAAVEFGLAIVDDHVCVGAYDDGGNLVVTVDGTDESFFAWAMDVFEEYRARSECLSAGDSSIGA